MDIIDFTVRRGNNNPAMIWALQDEEGEPFPVEGRSLVLTIVWRDGSLTKESVANDGLSVDAATSQVTWTPTIGESRSIPPGRRARYELECRTGAEQVTIAAGSVTGAGGLNSD
ncbi:MAG: hypothetical protein ACAH20_16940 [Methylobacteriaceae bacterium]